MAMTTIQNFQDTFSTCYLYLNFTVELAGGRYRLTNVVAKASNPKPGSTAFSTFSGHTDAKGNQVGVFAEISDEHATSIASVIDHDGAISLPSLASLGRNQPRPVWMQFNLQEGAAWNDPPIVAPSDEAALSAEFASYFLWRKGDMPTEAEAKRTCYVVYNNFDDGVEARFDFSTTPALQHPERPGGIVVKNSP